MEFILKGKAQDVFGRLSEMKNLAEAGGGVIYQGTRGEPGDVNVLRMEIASSGKVDIRPLSPEPSRKLWNHSPDGFEWGYCGSGPAQLALALLLDALGDEKLAVCYHQAFKECFVAGWKSIWDIRAGQIKRWVQLRQHAEDARLMEPADGK